MEVLIDNRQGKHQISQKKIRQTARAILSALDCPDGELSILIVDDPQIEKLNHTYLNRKGPTNVIAFPMRQGEYSDVSPHLLGDVVISIDTAAKEGKQAGISKEKRLIQLLIHGILHLFGYGHEQSETRARQMEEKSKEILALVESLNH